MDIHWHITSKHLASLVYELLYYFSVFSCVHFFCPFPLERMITELKACYLQHMLNKMFTLPLYDRSIVQIYSVTYISYFILLIFTMHI